MDKAIFSNFTLHPGVINFFVLSLGSLIISIVFNIIISLYINLKCTKLSELFLIDKEMIIKVIKNDLLDSSYQSHIEENNNFFLEFLYFILTTVLAVTGILFNNTLMLILFFAIKTSRHVVMHSKIVYFTIGDKYLPYINEKEIYSAIFYSEILSLEDIFNGHDSTVENEIEVLSLKFKELARNNKVDFNFYNELLSRKELDSKVKELIDSKYYNMILEK